MGGTMDFEKAIDQIRDDPSNTNGSRHPDSFHDVFSPDSHCRPRFHLLSSL